MLRRVPAAWTTPCVSFPLACAALVPCSFAKHVQGHVVDHAVRLGLWYGRAFFALSVYFQVCQSQTISRYLELSQTNYLQKSVLSHHHGSEPNINHKQGGSYGTSAPIRITVMAQRQLSYLFHYRISFTIVFQHIVRTEDQDQRARFYNPLQPLP